MSIRVCISNRCGQRWQPEAPTSTRAIRAHDGGMLKVRRRTTDRASIRLPTSLMIAAAAVTAAKLVKLVLHQGRLGNRHQWEHKASATGH